MGQVVIRPREAKIDGDVLRAKAGFVPTQFGKKILALIQHNFEPTLREANED